jgi:LysM repeat protein
MAARINGSTVCLALALALAVLGCGGDGDVEEPAPTPDQTAPETPVEETSPAAGPEEEGETEGEVYVVQSGDTLSSLAERFDTTVEAIVEANDLENPDLIIVGDELVIPADS